MRVHSVKSSKKEAKQGNTLIDQRSQEKLWTVVREKFRSTITAQLLRSASDILILLKRRYVYCVLHSASAFLRRRFSWR